MMTYNYVWLLLPPLLATVMSETKEEVKAVESSMRGEEFGLDGLMMMVLSSFDSWLVVNLWHKQCFMFTTMPFLLTFQVCANCSLDYVSVIVTLIVNFILISFSFLFFFKKKSQTHSLPSDLQMFGSGYCSLMSYQLKLRHLLFSYCAMWFTCGAAMFDSWCWSGGWCDFSPHSFLLCQWLYCYTCFPSSVGSCRHFGRAVYLDLLIFPPHNNWALAWELVFAVQLYLFTQLSANGDLCELAFRLSINFQTAGMTGLQRRCGWEEPSSGSLYASTSACVLSITVECSQGLHLLCFRVRSC